MTFLEIALSLHMLGTIAGSVAYCLGRSRRLARIRG
jgi:hypothetical protein